VSDDTLLWYGRDGKPIDAEEAMRLLEDREGRVVTETELDFMGWKILVSTTFVPVDHSSTWGTLVENPAVWMTEIIGGPEDLNGITEYYRSKQEAIDSHLEVVARAVASGCSVV